MKTFFQCNQNIFLSMAGPKLVASPQIGDRCLYLMTIEAHNFHCLKPINLTWYFCSEIWPCCYQSYSFKVAGGPRQLIELGAGAAQLLTKMWSMAPQCEEVKSKAASPKPEQPEVGVWKRHPLHSAELHGEYHMSEAREQPPAAGVDVAGAGARARGVWHEHDRTALQRHNSAQAHHNDDKAHWHSAWSWAAACHEWQPGWCIIMCTRNSCQYSPIGARTVAE